MSQPAASLTTLSRTTDQQNSTALKWSRDGELSEQDLQRILGLLSQVDPVAEALLSHRGVTAESPSRD